MGLEKQALGKPFSFLLFCVYLFAFVLQVLEHSYSLFASYLIWSRRYHGMVDGFKPKKPFLHRQTLLKSSSVISPCTPWASARLIGAEKENTESTKVCTCLVIRAELEN